MVSVHGDWDWERLGALLSREKLELITSVQPPRSDASLDRSGWRWETKRTFSVRSAYGYLVHGLEFGNGDTWKRVWKLAVPQRVRVFIWLTFHNRLLTNVERVRRHVATSEFGQGVWMRALPRERWASFFSLSFLDWLRFNLFDTSFCAEDGDWRVRFAITCWLLWKRRCRLLFDPDVGVMDDILRRGGRLVEECSRASCVAKGPQARQLRASTWSRPRVGWVKLNVDASVSTVDRSVGIGGVIRDNHEKWLFGFVRFVGRCEALLAELWAIHDGLMHAWDLGYCCVEVESDCLDVVQIVTARSKALEGSALVGSILQMLSKDWSVVVNHVGRGSNGVADALAQWGRGSSMEQVSFSEAPDEVACIVENEKLSSFPTALSVIDERVVPFDPGGLS
ncbi:hypothetical protein GQ457_11G003510 [Hibiscus cannabinus]